MKSKTQKPKNKSKIRKWINLFIALTLCGSVAVTCLYGFDNSEFETTFYQVKSDKVTEGFRIVQLSDLHLNAFGEDNQQLISRIQSLKPDLIAITGDMILSHQPTTQPVVELCQELIEVAPVYYSWGNHEAGDIYNGYNTDFPDKLKETGVEILNFAEQEITVNENEVVIGGICANSSDILDKGAEFLTEFSAHEEFTLLLCHYPDVFDEKQGLMEDFPVDLALCGHLHGGIVKLPVIGALYTNEEGFFPKLTGGCNQLSGSTVVISRGLGNSNWVPRFNNPPELVVVDVNCY